MSSSPLTSEARGGRRFAVGLVALALAIAVDLSSRSARAAGKQGEFIQTSALGVNLLTHDLDTGSTRSVRDFVNLSEYVGLHGYVVDRVRLGATLQLSERLWPNPAPDSRIQRFAILPQVAWNFFDPFFAAVVFGFSPRNDGRAHLNLSLQGVLGVSLPLSNRVRFSIAGQVPWTFYDRHSVGVVAVTGLAIRL